MRRLSVLPTRRSPAVQLAALLVALLVGLNLFTSTQGSQAWAADCPDPKACGEVRPNTTSVYTTFNGNPFKVNVGNDSAFQIFLPGSTLGQFYSPSSPIGATGLFIVNGSNVYGPSGVAAGLSTTEYTNKVVNAPTGDGSAGNPYRIVSSYTVPGVAQVTQVTSYINGANQMQLDYQFTPAGGSSLARVYLAGDIYFRGSDYGYGFYDTRTGSVGGFTRERDQYLAFQPLTAPNAFYEGGYGDVWRRIGSATAPGVGFDNTISNSYIDNGAGLQWNTVSTGGRISALVRIGGNPLTAAALGYRTQPANAIAGQSIGTIQIAALDGAGNTDTSFNGNVTINLKSGTGTSGAKLVGPNTVNAINGIATFYGLSVDTPGTGYVLSAPTSTLATADSNPFNIAAPPPATSAYYHPLATPARVYDSRTAAGVLAPGATRAVTVAGVGGIPAGATGVVGNLTVANTRGGGYLSLYQGGTWPGNSSINWDSAGQAVANFSIVQLSGGTFTARNSSDPGSQAADFIFDAIGYLDNNATGAGYLNTVDPFRAYDSRTSGGVIPAGGRRDVTISSSAIPAGATAAIVNLTAAQTGGPGGYVSVYAKGTALPGETAGRISSLNWNYANEARANFAIVPLSSDKGISVYAVNTSTQFILDVVGYVSPTSSSTNLALTAGGRLYDSRGLDGGLTANSTRISEVGGRLSVPSTAKAAIVNLTIANTVGSGYLSLYPGTASVPPLSSRISTINWIRPNQTIANLVIVPLDSYGELKAFAGENTTQYLIDVVGYLS